MSGLEPLMLVAAAGGSAMQAGSQIMAGRETARAAAYEQQQLKAQEETYRIAAAQDETQRRDELNSSLETIQAIRAGRGVGAGSPTENAILTSATDDAESDILTSRLNYLTKADSSRTSAEMAGKKAKTSLLAGYLNAGSTLANTAFKLGTSGKY